MSLGHGISVVKSGLALHFDASNSKSFRGESTSNLVIFPKSITTGYAASGVTRSDNQLLNFDKTFTAGSLTNSGWIAYTDASTLNNNRYTTSWYVKAGTVTTCSFTWGGAHQGNTTNFTFNLLTGAISNLTLATGENYGVDNLRDGWWRVWYSSTLSTGNAYYPQLFNGNGVMYVGGLQIEQKPYATPFVDGVRGTTVETGGGLVDLSGNNNHGELVNGVSFNSSNRGYLLFDGIDDYISTNYAPNLDNNRVYTYELVFKDDIAGEFLSNLALISNYGLSGTVPYSGLHINDNGTVRFVERNSSSSSVTITSANVVDNTWKHIVGVADSQNLILYINGLQVGVGARPGGVITSGQNYVLGSQHLSRFQSCQISIFKIYIDKALTLQEIKKNFNAIRGRYNI